MIEGKQRINDQQEGLRTAFEGMQSHIWTALPAIIVKVDYTKQTLTAQPAINGSMTDEKGNKQDIKMPLLVDVPFQCYGGSGFVVTMPNLEGSECLIVFSSRCIDGWWLNGGTQSQVDERMHDLSDGMAIIGFNSQKRLIPNYNQESLEIRTFDGSCKISMGNGNVDIISDTLTHNGVNIGSTHIHGGVQSGGSNTAVPH